MTPAQIYEWSRRALVVQESKILELDIPGLSPDYDYHDHSVGDVFSYCPTFKIAEGIN